MNVKHIACKSFTKVIDKYKAFTFRSYSCNPRGITNVQLFEEQGGEISLVPREAYLVEVQALLEIMAAAYSLTSWSQGKVWSFAIPKGY